MKLRRFLFLLPLLLWPIVHVQAQHLFRYPVVGGVTDSSAAVSVWLESQGSIGLEYGLDSTLADAVPTGIQTSMPDNDNVVHFTLPGLFSARRYYYRIVDVNGTAISKTFSFRTFPPVGRDADVSLLFGSCSRNSLSNTGRTFEVGAGLGGDYFVHLGDWSYPDVLVSGYPGSPGSIRESYAVRLDTTYPLASRILTDMGIAYEWDDHDFSGNNGNGAIPDSLKSKLLAAYDRYLPHYRLENPSAGIWHSFRIGNVEVFMIDARAQRSPIDSAFRDGKFVPPPGHSLLAGFPVDGTDQLTWLLGAIRSSTARWKILASQGPFNPDLGSAIPLALLVGRSDIAREVAEYWGGYPTDLDSLRSLLRGQAGRNVLIISGSVHNNMFDDGQHSIVPEFVAANLDIPNSNLYDSLRKYGFDVWTAGQSNSKSTIGRIRVETTPTQRLIVESFDEDGEPMLSYEMTDQSSDVPPAQPAAAMVVRNVAVVDQGAMIRIEFGRAIDHDARLQLFDLLGKKVLDRFIPSGTRIRSLPLAETIPGGSYVGRVVSEGTEIGFRVVIVR